jgi:hypothetical protein
VYQQSQKAAIQRAPIGAVGSSECWAAQNPHNLSIEVNATLPLRLFKQAFLSGYFSYAVLGGISIDKLFLFSQTMPGAAQVIDKLNSFEATSVGRSLYVRDCCKVGGLQKAARLG